LLEYTYILVKVIGVTDVAVGAKGNVEFTALIETTEAIETSTVKVIEELGAFGGSDCISSDKFIESITVPVKQFFVIAHLDVQLETPLQMTIKVDEMRINVVE
jgi:hypothetical protein